MKKADNLIERKETFMWLYKPIENKQNTAHTGIRACAYTLNTRRRINTPTPTTQVCNSFKDWSCVFMFWRHYTHIKWVPYAETGSEKLFLVSEDILLIHWASLDSYRQGPKQRPTHTLNVPTEECCELFKGPAMLFPEPHRGFSENKAQMKRHALVL